MNTGQSNVEHNIRVLDGVINDLANRFHKFKKEHDNSEKDDEHLSMLAGKLGYLINVSAGATKTWNYEERIIKLEKEKEDPILESTKKQFQFNPDIMLTVVRDNNGKLMN